jgi:hypothetical protein
MPHKYKGVEWTEAPGHPTLRYTEQGDELILEYHKSHVHTTWVRVERVAALRKIPDGKSSKPNKEAIKRGLKGLMPAPHTQNKKCGVSLFVRLVADGEITRSGC